MKEKFSLKKYANVIDLRVMIVQSCREISEDLHCHVMPCLQEVFQQNGGHIEHVINRRHFSKGSLLVSVNIVTFDT
jgi:hypothetical protein